MCEGLFLHKFLGIENVCVLMCVVCSYMKEELVDDEWGVFGNYY